MARIHWNDEEVRQVAVKWIEICETTGENPLTPTYSSTIAREAQLVLPSDRHRPEASLTGQDALKKIFKALPSLIEQRKKFKETPAAQARAEAAEAAETAERRRLQEQETLTPRVPPTQSLEQAIKTGTLEEQVRSLGAAVSSILMDEFMKAARATFATEFPKLVARATAVTKVLPRILVCGPLPKQQPLLEEAVAGIADLKFVSSEESARLIKLRGQSCVAGISWINYVNHGHTDAVKSLFGDDRAVLVKGGMDTLKARIEEVALHAQIPDAMGMMQ